MTTPISIVKISPKSGVTSYINLLNVADVICSHNEDGTIYEVTVSYSAQSDLLILEGDEAIPLLETLNALAGETERYTTFYKNAQREIGE